MEQAKAFGIVLRRFRRQANLTQEQLGFEADLQRVYVSALELGQKMPSLATIFKLAKALRCSASDLVAEVEAELRNPD
ncbi:helix-turn-helix domain-containing protein [Propionivibrio dicarboxylicus]|uniref:helix-turn-helix domain-containing protein n=1 Tax=Propionivibrio dicarboxylicus TaxID=83767 RepID=UPI000B8884B3|nr:helix-turn-helix transcriptional regulator [Propionivibrio dicarboxylicus]